MKKLTTLPAHFDGKEIKFDVPVSLASNTRLLVTILDAPEDEQQSPVYAAMAASDITFSQIWDNDEDAVYDDL